MPKHLPLALAASSTADAAGPEVRPLFDKQGVSAYLGVSERSVDRLVAAGRLRAVRVGGHRRFRPEDIDAFLAASEERR